MIAELVAILIVVGAIAVVGLSPIVLVVILTTHGVAKYGSFAGALLRATVVGVHGVVPTESRGGLLSTEIRVLRLNGPYVGLELRSVGLMFYQSMPVRLSHNQVIAMADWLDQLAFGQPGLPPGGGWFFYDLLSGATVKSFFGSLAVGRSRVHVVETTGVGHPVGIYFDFRRMLAIRLNWARITRPNAHALAWLLRQALSQAAPVVTWSGSVKAV